jgi:tRNA dimethylallyltransferase
LFDFATLSIFAGMQHKQKTVVIICGPTAVGKTSFAIKLAQHFQTEIISADSRQCYRELNIGVAKPSNEELSAVRHYFINSHSITDDVNAVVFEQYALTAANEIFKAHDIAIMVGGTGLYIKAFCEGLDDIPAVDEATRQKVTSMYNQHGIEYLQTELQQKDPAFWETAEQLNPQRLMRALEVLLSTGKSITTFRKGIKQGRDFNIIKIGLELPRDQLYQRVNLRVDQMMEAGLVKEVAELLPYRSLNALQTVGYQELFPVLDGTETIETGVEKLKMNTRRYAKRQITWFKKDVDVNWFSADTPLLDELVIQRIASKN